MTREGALIVILLVALVLAGLAVWGWRRRARRDAGIAAPVGDAPTDAARLGEFETLYVATTRADEPLERLAIRGLAFRSRARVSLTTAGVAVDLTGGPRIFLPSDRIASVDQATVAIDRVVEPEGLARLSWRTDDGTVVDSYFRPQDDSARALADAVRGILTPSQTGADE